MKIGVVADTHIPKRAKHLPKALLDGLKGVDLIIHAGDWVTADVVKSLKKIAAVEGVIGNNDGNEIKALFKYKKIVSVKGFKIGIVHGDGTKKTTVERARDAFNRENVDVIIFGHSHKPYHEYHDDILLFNPGSATDKRRQPKYSYGIIEINQTITARHIFYTDRS